MSNTLTLKQQLTEAMKAAMRAHEQRKLDCIRLILAAIKQREVDERIEMTDDLVLSVLDKMSKQRRDSIAQYQAGGRTDLVEQEQFELEIIQAYMPAPLSAAELSQLIEQAINSTQATSIKDMGKLMAELKPQIQGRADIADVSAQIKQRLSIEK